MLRGLLMQRTGPLRGALLNAAFALLFSGGVAAAQPPAPQAAQQVRPESAEDIVVPPDYVIGVADRLLVSYWRNEDMTAEVIVRPDGMISLPLLNDVQAAGLTPEQLREKVTQLAAAYVEAPNVQVIVRDIQSRRVFITGMVASPATYALTGPTTVLQLIAMAGGLLDFAKTKDIRIIRVEKGRQVAYRFNYNDVRQGRNLQQNIELKPGDTVVVP